MQHFIQYNAPCLCYTTILQEITLDEILDLHGCKYDANNESNMEHYIY